MIRLFRSTCEIEKRLLWCLSDPEYSMHHSLNHLLVNFSSSGTQVKTETSLKGEANIDKKNQIMLVLLRLLGSFCQLQASQSYLHFGSPQYHSHPCLVFQDILKQIL